MKQLKEFKKEVRDILDDIYDDLHGRQDFVHLDDVYGRIEDAKRELTKLIVR